MSTIILKNLKKNSVRYIPPTHAGGYKTPPFNKLLTQAKHRIARGEGFFNLPTNFHNTKLLRCEKNRTTKITNGFVVYCVLSENLSRVLLRDTYSTVIHIYLPLVYIFPSSNL